MDAELLRLLLITFLAAVLADLSMVFGVAPFFFLKDLSKRAAATLSAVAAGMMAVASLVQLVGEGLRRAPGLRVWGGRCGARARGALLRRRGEMGAGPRELRSVPVA
jgi:hypothetical protein